MNSSDSSEYIVPKNIPLSHSIHKVGQHMHHKDHQALNCEKSNPTKFQKNDTGPGSWNPPPNPEDQRSPSNFHKPSS